MNKTMFKWELYDAFRGTLEPKIVARLYIAMSASKVICENHEKYNFEKTSVWESMVKDKRDMIDLMNKLAARYDLGFFDGVANEFYKLNENLYEVLLDSVDKFHYSNTIEFCEEIKNTLVVETKFYEFSTPKNVFKIPVELMSINENSTVINYFNGTSSLFLEILKNKNNPNFEIDYYGQDINHEIYEIGQLIAFLLSGISQNIVQGDSLMKPRFTEGNRLKKFDYAISIPPFSMITDKHLVETDEFNRFPYINNKSTAIKSDWIIAQQLISSIKHNGKAAVLLPMGVLFRSGQEASIRKQIIQDDIIEAIVKLPENLFSYTAIATCWIIFNKNKSEEKRGKIQFIDLSNYHENIDRRMKAITDEGVDKAMDLFNRFVEDDLSIILDINDLEEREFNLNAFDFIKTENIYKGIEQEMIPLNDIAVIRRGVQVSKGKLDALNAAENKTHYMVSIGNINQEGNIEVNETDKIKVEPRWIDLYEAKEGDILITSRGNLFKIALVKNDGEKYIISSNLFIIRLDKSKYKPEILKFFLKSDIGQRLMESIYKGSIITSISNTDLENLMVPKISIEVQLETAKMINESESKYLSVVREAESVYNAKQKEIEAKLGIELEESIEMVLPKISHTK